MNIRIPVNSVATVALLLSLSACGMLGGGRSEAPENPVSEKLWVPRYSAVADEGLNTVDGDPTYTVKPGDDLRGIARRLTGSSANWRVLAAHNLLENPNVLEVGDVLILPRELLAEQNPESAATSKYDLISVLASAQDYDAEFRVAISNHEVAQKDLGIARSALLPQANAEYQIGYNDFSNDQSDEYVRQQAGLSLSQAIYDRAKSIAVRQAELSGSLADVQLQSDHEDLLIRVATSYFNVLRAQAALRFRQSDLDAIRRQLLQTRRLYDVGSIAITDVVEAQAQYDLAVAAEITAENQLATTVEALAVNTGLSATGELASLIRSIPLESPDPEDIDAWVQTALANNKQLLVARERVEIADQQVKLTRAGRLPVVGLTGTLSDIDTENDVLPDSSGGNLELGVSVPLFTGGRIPAQIAQDKSRARLASEQMLNTERQTIQTTRDTYRGVVAGVSTVEALRQALRSTSKAAEATKAGFDAGTRTSVELLQSLRDTFRAQSDYAGARYDYILDLLRLKRASGTLELADVQRVNSWLE